MASLLGEVTSTARTHPPIFGIYGSGGMGKTTLACEFPAPIYGHSKGERPPDDIDVPAIEIDSFDKLLDLIGELISEDHEFGTLIIDSVDAIEPMVWEHTCSRMGWHCSIDSNDKGSPTAFGKGYLEADKDWLDYISAIVALAKSGVYVVQIMHSEARAWDDPVLDSYNRYQPRMQKRARNIIVENSDALLFINKRTNNKEIDKGFGQKQTKVDGSSGVERMIYTDERTGFLAKNRFGMPPSIPYKKGRGFHDLSKYISGAN